MAYKQKDYDVRFNLLNVTDEEYFEAGSGRAVRDQRSPGRLWDNHLSLI